MNNIYFFSGPCGCGKTTLANAFARYLVNRPEGQMIYLIHGDDFHRGFIEPDCKGDFFVDGQASDALLWNDILQFNWDCILTVARKALDRKLDVVIDYIVEDELPLVQQLAKESDAKLHYVVLTAESDTIRRRILQRGDSDMVERALFLKDKLDHLPENQGHLYDITGMTVEQEVERLDIGRFLTE